MPRDWTARMAPLQAGQKAADARRELIAAQDNGGVAPAAFRKKMTAKQLKAAEAAAARAARTAQAAAAKAALGVAVAKPRSRTAQHKRKADDVDDQAGAAKKAKTAAEPAARVATAPGARVTRAAAKQMAADDAAKDMVDDVNDEAQRAGEHSGDAAADAGLIGFVNFQSVEAERLAAQRLEAEAGDTDSDNDDEEDAPDAADVNEARIHTDMLYERSKQEYLQTQRSLANAQQLVRQTAVWAAQHQPPVVPLFTDLGFARDNGPPLRSISGLGDLDFHERGWTSE
jgi:hypothetical protein